MKIALIAGLVAAAVAAGSALAGGSTPPPRAAHARPAAPSHPVPHSHPAPHSQPLSNAQIGRMVAAWSAAHPGWKNPAQMTHAEMLRAAVAHPAVYAPNLNRSSMALRIFDQYGAWTTLSPHVRALERAQGVPIPANLPYVQLNSLVPASRVAAIEKALAALRQR